jgi:hypothetical protein
MIEADDPVHFGAAEIQRLCNLGFGIAVYAAECFLDVVQNRQQRAFAMRMGRDDFREARRPAQ